MPSVILRSGLLTPTPTQKPGPNIAFLASDIDRGCSVEYRVPWILYVNSQ